MAIIIGDIHGDIEKAKAFLAHKPDKEHVCLGDLIDNIKKGITLNDELACLDLLLSSNTVLLWGNHDIAYTLESPWPSMTNHTLTTADIEYYADYSDFLKGVYEKIGELTVRDIFIDRLLPHIERFQAAYSVDGWLCTHAGVAPGIANIVPTEVLTAGSLKIAEWLNEEFQRERYVPAPPHNTPPEHYGYGPLFQIDICRFGPDQFGGVFWFDPAREKSEPSPLVGRQIFGHTPVPYPELGAHWVNMNHYNEGIWIYDTDINCLVNIGSDDLMTVSTHFPTI